MALQTANTLTTVLGPAATVVSAFFGFLGGTVINHWLASRRYDRERKDKQIDICQGLIGEILVNIEYLAMHLGPERPIRVAAGDGEPVTYVPITGYYDGVRGELGFLGWNCLSDLHSHYSDLRQFSERINSPISGAKLLDGSSRIRDEVSGWSNRSRFLVERLKQQLSHYLKRSDRLLMQSLDGEPGL